MPGFLQASGYDGVEHINLGNGYWAEVKKCLSSAEASFAESAMIGNHQLGDTGQSAELDSRSYRVELIVQSLVSWNLDEEDGRTLWPLESGQKFGGPGKNPYPPHCPRRQSVARLPEPVFEQIFQKCDELNSPRKGSEAARFPEQAERSDPDGDGSAADPDPVPDGTGAVAAVRADAGEGAGTPAP